MRSQDIQMTYFAVVLFVGFLKTTLVADLSPGGMVLTSAAFLFNLSI